MLLLGIFISKNNKKKKKKKQSEKIDHSKIESPKIDDRNSTIEKKIDCFPTDQSKKIDHRFLIGIASTILASFGAGSFHIC